MQHFKNRLSRIRGLMESRLPDTPDIYGYSGVDKVMLLNVCQEIYSLAGMMEARTPSHEFEIVALKRYEARIHEELKKFLEEEGNDPKARDKFDEFLNNFSLLFERTKQVYFIVSKDGLRDELEIQALRDQVATLKAQQAEYEELVEELRVRSEAATTRTLEIETSLTEATRQIESHSKEAEEAHRVLNSHQLEITNWHRAISTFHEQTAGWDGEIRATLERATGGLGKVTDLVTQLEIGIENLDEATVSAENLTKETTRVHDQNQALIQEIQDTLGDSNRVGMAASFQQQMELVKTGMEQWKKVFIGSLIALVGMVLIVTIVLHLMGGVVTWQTAVVRFALLSPLVWLAWFAARQYGYANRVREDYTYKYASAMAYEGYKKAVREADPSLEKSLVEVAIMNMAQNPVRLYSPKESDHASPFSEFFEKVFGRLKGAKVSATQAGISAETRL